MRYSKKKWALEFAWYWNVYNIDLFKPDVLSLLPLELLYFAMGVDATYLRFPRLIKVLSFWDFTARLDSILGMYKYLGI